MTDVYAAYNLQTKHNIKYFTRKIDADRYVRYINKMMNKPILITVDHNVFDTIDDNLVNELKNKNIYLIEMCVKPIPGIKVEVVNKKVIDYIDRIDVVDFKNETHDICWSVIVAADDNQSAINKGIRLINEFKQKNN